MRVVQGAGAAVVMTLGLALLTSAFPPERRGAALGLFSAVTGIAVACGPLVGGAVVDGLAWQWIFWLNVPVGLVAAPLVLRLVPGGARCRTAGSMSPGVVLLAAGVLGLVWALVRGEPAGWTSAEVLGTAAAGLALLRGFAAWERRAPLPAAAAPAAAAARLHRRQPRHRCSRSPRSSRRCSSTGSCSRSSWARARWGPAYG